MLDIDNDRHIDTDFSKVNIYFLITMVTFLHHLHIGDVWIPMYTPFLRPDIMIRTVHEGSNFICSNSWAFILDYHGNIPSSPTYRGCLNTNAHTVTFCRTWYYDQNWWGQELYLFKLLSFYCSLIYFWFDPPELDCSKYIFSIANQYTLNSISFVACRTVHVHLYFNTVFIPLLYNSCWILVQSKLYIKGTQGNMKTCPFMSSCPLYICRLKLYTLFIKGKSDAVLYRQWFVI